MTSAEHLPEIQARLLSLNAAAAYLGGIHTDTVHELVAAGKLTKVRVGRRSFITHESLDAFIDAQIAGDDE